MLKKYAFVIFNILILVLFGYILDLLGTADDVAVGLGVLSLAGMPFVYIFGLKRFGYYERIKNAFKHFKDVLNGDL